MKGTQVDNQATAQQPTSQDIYNQPNQAAPHPQAQPQQQAAPVGGNRGGLSALMSRGRIGNLSKDSTGRMLADLTKKLQDYYEEIRQTELPGYEVRVVPQARNTIIGAENNLSNGIGLILFIVGRNNHFAFHSLLLASDMAQNAPTRTNDMYATYSQEQNQPPRTSAALADPALADVIAHRARQLLPQADKVFSADWSTVPTDFALNDPYAIASVFLNSARACVTELETKTPGFSYTSLASVAGDGVLVNSIHLNQDQAGVQVDVLDPVGLPARHEILTDFHSEQPRLSGQKDQTENTAGIWELGHTAAYVTLNIDPSPGRQNRYMSMGGPAQPGDTQEYSPEVTISNFDMGLNPDLGNVLLQLSTMLPLVDFQQRAWQRLYLPRHLQHTGAPAHGNFRPRDLGGVNYDYGMTTPDSEGRPVVAPFPTNDENAFKMENFFQLINAIVQPAAALSIDVPVAGAETWFLRIFAEATEVPAAYDAIVKAMDALTDNKFSQIFFAQGSSRLIVLPRVERVLNGYFIDQAGRKRDVREVDMVYLLNAKGHQDPTIGKRFARTFAGSTDAMLAERAKIISEVVTPVFTGVSIHKTFHPDFLRAMDQSIAATNLKPRVDMSQQNTPLLMAQPYGLAQAGALARDFTTTMFSSGPAYAGPQQGYRGMAHNRTY